MVVRRAAARPAGDAAAALSAATRPEAGEPPAPVLVVGDGLLPAALAECGRELRLWRSAGPGSGGRASGTGCFGGDPARPETYAAAVRPGEEPLVVVDGGAVEGVGRVLDAVSAAFPDAPVLVIGGGGGAAGRSAGRSVPWPTLLAGELGSELARLEALRRVRRLRRFARGAAVVPVLIQDEPDPDAIASAFAVRVLLRRRPSHCPIVSLGSVVRPENRRMAELLRLRVTRITRAELRRFRRVVAVDVQPVALRGGCGRLAVIDHHPPEGGYAADFADVRPGYGATATILTEYLRADDEGRIRRRLATALLYGIRTDTAALSRGTTAADVAAYGFLQPRADPALLARIERPSYPDRLVRSIGHGLAALRAEAGVVAVFLGRLAPGDAHVLSEVADFGLTVEGAAWTVAGALVDDALVLALRHRGDGPGAGTLARRLAAAGGSGGGHATMARVELPERSARRVLGIAVERDRAAATASLLRVVGAEIRRLDGDRS